MPSSKAVLVPVFLAAGSVSFADSARTLLDASIRAIGGRDALRRISSVKASSVAQSHYVEQSERPTGPFLNDYFDGTETVSFSDGTYATEGKVKGVSWPEWGGGTRSITFEQDGKVAAQRGADEQWALEARWRLCLGPERVLLTAEAAKDLALAPRETFQGIPHDVLTFTWGDRPVRVLLNAYSHLPTAIDLVSEWPGFWSVWGDVTSRLVLGNWALEPGGLRFPLQWQWERNGQPVREVTITKVALTGGGDAAKPEGWSTVLAPRRPTGNPPVPKYQAAEIAPGVTQFKSGFNCAVVDQGDGLVFLEGTTSSAYMEGILAATEKLHPGKRIKAVITTSDAWPHMAGLRPFAARGIPIYCLAENEPIVKRMLDAPHSIRPDALQARPRRGILKRVSAPLTIGKGTNRLTVIPLRGEGTERQMMVYFPERKVLYSTDAIQPKPDGTFYYPVYADEVRIAVEREEIPVDTVFGMHLPSRPWEDVRRFLSTWTAPKAP